MLVENWLRIVVWNSLLKAPSGVFSSSPYFKRFHQLLTLCFCRKMKGLAGTFASNPQNLMFRTRDVGSEGQCDSTSPQALYQILK